MTFDEIYEQTVIDVKQLNTDQLIALLNKLCRHRWDSYSDDMLMGLMKAAMERAAAALATPSATAMHQPQMAECEFGNEFGNRIKITIEGPSSVSEDILTQVEASRLRDVLNEALSSTASLSTEVKPEMSTVLTPIVLSYLLLPIVQCPSDTWVNFWRVRGGKWVSFEGRRTKEGIEYRSGEKSLFNTSTHFSWLTTSPTASSELINEFIQEEVNKAIKNVLSDTKDASEVRFVISDVFSKTVGNKVRGSDSVIFAANLMDILQQRGYAIMRIKK